MNITSQDQARMKHHIAAIISILAMGLTMFPFTAGADPYGMSPLHYAARDGALGVIKQQARPATVNARDKYNRTPLHIAATFGQAEAATALLNAGAEINARDQWGVTPLKRARLMVQYRNIDCTELIKLLLDRGAEP